MAEKRTLLDPFVYTTAGFRSIHLDLASNFDRSESLNKKIYKSSQLLTIQVYVIFRQFLPILSTTTFLRTSSHNLTLLKRSYKILSSLYADRDCILAMRSS